MGGPKTEGFIPPFRSGWQSALGGWAGDGSVLGLVAVSLAFYYFPSHGLVNGLGAAAFVALAWWRLDLALVAVLFTAPLYLFPKELSPTIFGLDNLIGRAEPLRVSLGEFTVLGCLFGWGARGAAALFQSISLRHSWPYLQSRDLLISFGPPASLLLAAVLSLSASEYLRFSLRELRVVVLEPLLFYVMLRSVVRKPGNISMFFNAFILLGLMIALVGLYHYFFVGIVEATGGVRRMLAVYHSPNALALFLGRVAPMAVIMAWGTGNPWQRAFYLVTSLVTLVTLYFTYSRGAWLAVALALLFALSMVRPKVAILVAGGTLLALLAIQPILPMDRLLAAAPVTQRVYVWKAAMAMALDHPIRGVGLDNFLYQYPKYMLPEAWAEPNVSHPHNILLDFWLRLGILGVVALVWLQWAFWRAGKAWGDAPSGTEERAVILALMASMVDFLAHGLIDNSFFLIDLAYIFWLTYGLVVTLSASGGAVSPKAPAGRKEA